MLDMHENHEDVDFNLFQTKKSEVVQQGARDEVMSSRAVVHSSFALLSSDDSGSSNGLCLVVE